MAETVVQADHMNDLLRCSICLETFTDPRALPCLHTFCCKCISQLCKDKRSGEQVACPDCRSEFVISDNGVGGLKKNFFVENLLSLYEVKSKSKTTVDITAEICEICVGEDKKVAVEVFCLQCEQRYCKSCSIAHSRMKNSSSHTLVSCINFCDRTISDLAINKNYQSIFCNKHEGKEADLYCQEDEVAVCMECYVNDHSSHKCQKVMKISAKCRIGLEHDIQCVTTVLNEIDEKLRNLNSRKQSVFDKVKSVETELCKKAYEMVQLIESQKQKLIYELIGIKAKHLAEIDRLIEECNQTRVLIETFTNDGNALLKKGSDLDIGQEAAGLRKRAQELVNNGNLDDALKNLDVVKITFTPFRFALDATKSMIGRIATGETSIIVRTMQVRSGVTALAVMNNELFVARHTIRQVSVFDSTTLDLKRKISVPELGQWPYGLAACPSSNLLFISDYDNQRVHRVDLSFDSVTSWKTAPAPLGLSLTSKHNLLVTCGCLPSNKVREYTPAGTLLREVLSFSKLYQAVETIHDRLLVSSNSDIAELTWNGEVLRSCILMADAEPQNQLDKPRSMAATSKATVFVADMGNNRIQVIDSSLATARTFQLPDDITVKLPRALCYDESRDRLFLGEGFGEWRVLVFDHVSRDYLEVLFEK